MPGERVFAIRSANDDTVNLFGFGVYAGDQLPPGQPDDDTLQLARGAYEGRGEPFSEQEVREFAESMTRNPRIDLDDGGYVWGRECWWGAEDRFEVMAAGRTIVRVPPPERP